MLVCLGTALAEDAADASWAGQLESYLNVERGRLEESIRACWRSIESERARNYAADKNTPDSLLFVGVAVQAMVEADAAGVMFTVNPVTGKREECVIEAAYGLGELVVQGAVTPDNFIVDTKENAVAHFGIAIKERMMVFDSGKNVVVPVPEKTADRAVLREDQVLELAALGKRIATHYRAPQDIEWCVKDGAFFIVQSRPITTIP